MIIDPGTYYDELYWSAQKKYRVILPDGSIEERTYYGPALWWDGFGNIAQAIVAALHARDAEKGLAPWLDIGCGAGCFVSFLFGQGIDAYGVDISTYAIDHAPYAVRSRVAVGDAIACGVLSPMPQEYAVVSALDLVEHIYAKDQEALWQAFWRYLKPGGRLVLDVATAHHPRDVWEAEPGIPVPLEREWQSVSGHVFVMETSYWIGWASARGWKLDQATMDAFQSWRRFAPGYDVMEAWDERNFLVFSKG